MINRTAKSPSQYHNQSQHTVHIQSYVYSTYTITSYIYIHTLLQAFITKSVILMECLQRRHMIRISHSQFDHIQQILNKKYWGQTRLHYMVKTNKTVFLTFFVLFIPHISSFSHPLSHSLIPNTDFLHINFPHKYSFKEIWSHLLK